MAEPYSVRTFSPMRRMGSTLLRSARQKNIIHGLIEVDVTPVRAYMRDHRERTGETLSMTAFFLSCLAAAVAEEPALQAFRVGNRQYIFDDVDVMMQLERQTAAGEKIVATHVVRAANQKTFRQIHHEIRQVQHEPLENQQIQRLRNLMAHFPMLFFRLYWWYAGRNIHVMRRYGAMVGITSVGMFGSSLGWGIPISFATVHLTVGGIGEKPGIVDGQIAIREYASLTLSFDHDMVDGAPAARFCQRFRTLIESGYGLLNGDDA